MGKNTLLVHVLDDNLKEIGKPVRTKTHAQEVSYKKRMWAINHISDDVKITDNKGITHSFVHANEADGVFHFITPARMNLFGFSAEQEIIVEETDNEGKKVRVKKKLELPTAIAQPLDMCTKCGDRITIDARNQRDLLKRKTIDTFWGLDSSHILLLIIMGIVAIGSMGGIFYLLGANQKLQEQLNKYLPPPDTVKKTAFDFNDMNNLQKEILSYA